MGPSEASSVREGANKTFSHANLTGVCETGRLEQDMVESTLALHELLDRGDTRVLYATAEAPVCELQELLGLLRRVIRGGDVDRLC